MRKFEKNTHAEEKEKKMNQAFNLGIQKDFFVLTDKRLQSGPNLLMNSWPRIIHTELEIAQSTLKLSTYMVQQVYIVKIYHTSSSNSNFPKQTSLLLTNPASALIPNTKTHNLKQTHDGHKEDILW